MPFPYSDLFTASDLADRFLAVSERTQLLFIKFAELAEQRTTWDEMTDEEWDDLHDFIATAETELLLEEAPLPQLTLTTYTAQRLNSNQSILAAGSFIEWDTSDFPAVDESWVRLIETGYYVVSVNFRLAQPPSTATYLVQLWKNGTSMMEFVNSVASTNGWFNLTWQFNAEADDFLQVLIDPSVATTLRVDLLDCICNVAVWYEV